jgi:hypothetical protein
MGGDEADSSEIESASTPAEQADLEVAVAADNLRHQTDEEAPPG